MFKRILAIGDIHGNYDKLLSVYDKINHNPQEDLLVFLGDYIDRGTQNLACLNWILSKSQEPNVVVLRGNHEQMMLDFFNGNDDFGCWESNGGDKTLHELNKNRYDKFRKLRVYLPFLKSLPVSYSYENFFFAHAGIAPYRSFENQSEEDLLWIREVFFQGGYCGDTVIVVGHTPTQCFSEEKNTPIFFKNNIIDVDTGSFLPHGKISCVDVLTKQFWQND